MARKSPKENSAAWSWKVILVARAKGKDHDQKVEELVGYYQNLPSVEHMYLSGDF
jgi:hypothetical protein